MANHEAGKKKKKNDANQKEIKKSAVQGKKVNRPTETSNKPRQKVRRSTSDSDNLKTYAMVSIHPFERDVNGKKRSIL